MRSMGQRGHHLYARSSETDKIRLTSFRQIFEVQRDQESIQSFSTLTKKQPTKEQNKTTAVKYSSKLSLLSDDIRKDRQLSRSIYIATQHYNYHSISRKFHPGSQI